MSPSAKRPTRRSVPGPALSGPHHPNPLQGNSNLFQQNLLCALMPCTVSKMRQNCRWMTPIATSLSPFFYPFIQMRMSDQ